MHAVTFTRRAFFPYDVRPEALLAMFRMAHLTENLHLTSLAVRPFAARARDLRRSCKRFRQRAGGRRVLRHAKRGLFDFLQWLTVPGGSG